MKMIARQLQPQIERALHRGKMVALFGPRQVGKTTLAKAILAAQSGRSAYVSCDLPEVRRLLQDARLEDLRRFVGGNRLVVLDEAQRVEGIGVTLKILHEHFPATQFLVTGSSSFALGRSVKEPLTGRKYEFFLPPVSLAELAATRDHVALRESLPALLRFGAYPEVLTSEDPARVIQSVADDYLFRDILEQENFKSVSVLRALLEAVALQLGQEVSLHELSGLVGVSRQTVERYLDLLDRSFVIFPLRALSRNPRVEIAKSRKIYFRDLGIRNALIRNFNDLHLRTDVGALWENFCVVERMKTNDCAGRRVGAYFWRTYAQKELDYVEEAGGKLAAFEFKWGGGGARGSAEFMHRYPGSRVEVIDRNSVWTFAGVVPSRVS
jgi:uncharacterized protein